VAAIEAGKFDDEMVPVPVPQAKGDPILVTRDENPRGDTTIEKLAKLKPVLKGVCTAGNSSTENDGAAAVVVTSAEKARDIAEQSLNISRSLSDTRGESMAYSILGNIALSSVGGSPGRSFL